MPSCLLSLRVFVFAMLVGGKSDIPRDERVPHGCIEAHLRKALCFLCVLSVPLWFFRELDGIIR